jgi:hypothetical protein
MASRKTPKSEEERRRDKIRYYENERGIKHLTDPGPARQRIIIWRQKGIVLKTISERTGVTAWQIQNIETGRTGQIRTTTHAQIMSARFTREDVSKFSAVGTRRRLCALAAVGFSTASIAQISGIDRQILNRIQVGKEGQEFTTRRLGLATREAYEKYGNVDPLEIGQTQQAKSYVTGRAFRNGWAPPHCWDEDTIDDPSAYPEWTGKCGQLAGALIHLRENQPICQRCMRSVENKKNVMDVYKLYEVYQLGLTSAESAQLLGISKDLYNQYGQYLRPEERRVHTLSSLDKTARTAYCDACRCVVQVYQHNPSKFTCSNAVKTYRKEKGL